LSSEERLLGRYYERRAREKRREMEKNAEKRQSVCEREKTDNQ
jgi:hypothetical protein